MNVNDEDEAGKEDGNGDDIGVEDRTVGPFEALDGCDLGLVIRLFLFLILGGNRISSCRGAEGIASLLVVIIVVAVIEEVVEEEEAEEGGREGSAAVAIRVKGLSFASSSPAELNFLLLKDVGDENFPDKDVAAAVVVVAVLLRLGVVVLLLGGALDDEGETESGFSLNRLDEPDGDEVEAVVECAVVGTAEVAAAAAAAAAAIRGERRCC